MSPGMRPSIYRLKIQIVERLILEAREARLLLQGDPAGVEPQGILTVEAMMRLKDSIPTSYWPTIPWDRLRQEDGPLAMFCQRE